MNVDNSEIITILIQLVELLRNNDQAILAETFEHFIIQLKTNGNEQVLRDIMSLLSRGAGSFNDLVLHREKKVLIEENNKLYQLKKDLFNACLGKLN